MGELLNEVFSALVGLIGIIVTVATVVYTLALNKKDVLKDLVERRKMESGAMPLLENQIRGSRRYILKMQTVLSISIVLLCSSIIIIVLIAFSLVYTSHNRVVYNDVLAISGTVLFALTLLFYLIVAFLYRKDIRV